ncbi:hypothetical protein ACOMHN_024176 [Nucella lapillus]
MVTRLTMSVLQRLTSRGGAVLVGAATGLALTYTAYTALTQGQPFLKHAECKRRKRKGARKAPVIVEEEKPPGTDCCLPSVTSHDRAHALFLWIRVKQEADPQDVACSVARIQQYVDQVEAPMETSCGDFRILAGVGFGPEFYRQLKGGGAQAFTNAKHSLISSSSVGGDILIHAKSNDQELLKKLSKLVLQNLPKNSVLCHEETLAKTRYPEAFSTGDTPEDQPSVLSYQYTQGDMELFPPRRPVPEDKSLLLFVSDTGSQDTKFQREQAAMDSRTGGSYAMTQRWVHDLHLLTSNGDLTMNRWVDRAWEECAGPPGERKFKSPSMLTAELADVSMERWMGQAYQECLAMQRTHPNNHIVCTPGRATPRTPFRILRQSLPYSQGGESGLFFLSYASSPRYNELLLDRLVSSACGGGRLNSACMNVFRLSRNVCSACWYFPGLQELGELE